MQLPETCGASGRLGRGTACPGACPFRWRFLARAVPCCSKAVPHLPQNLRRAAGFSNAAARTAPLEPSRHTLHRTSSPRDSQTHSSGNACCLFTPLGSPGQGKRPRLDRQAAIFCGVPLLRRTPSTYCAPAYTAGSNSAPLSRRNVDSATCNIFQINAVAFSTFLNRLAEFAKLLGT